MARAHPRLGSPQRIYPPGGEVHRLQEDVVGRLEGRVVTVDGGRPVASAEITFVGPQGARTARTDGAGTFVLRE